MKNYRETYIRKAEIAQLILLHQIYSLTGSQELYFQGGTALRWCYGGSRFSEDLDFVTPLPPETVKAKIERAVKAAEPSMAAHFGAGALTLSDKSTRKDTLKLIVNYRPAQARENISIKLEFEGIRKDSSPETKNYVLSAMPAVAYLIASGDFKVPRPNAVLVVETASEILSGKVRALLERRYLKGRDIFDVWYLRTALKASADKAMLEKKFMMYLWSFHAARGFDFFTKPTVAGRKEMEAAIVGDLSRFLPPEALAVHKADGFSCFLSELQALFAELKKAGVALP